MRIIFVPSSLQPAHKENRAPTPFSCSEKQACPVSLRCQPGPIPAGQPLFFSAAVLFSFFFMFFFFIAGCTPAFEERGRVIEKEDHGFPLVAVDYAGRKIRFETPPESFISTHPANTEILFALGLGHKVKAVTTYCDYPPEIEEQRLAWGEWDQERLGEMVPALLLAGERQVLMADFAAMIPGLSSFMLAPKDYDEVVEAILLVGEIADSEGSAAEIAARMKEKKDQIRRCAARVQPAEQPTVLVLALFEEIMAAGENTLANELIDLAGGINAAATGEGFYALGENELLSLDPEIIIFLTPWEDYFAARNWRHDLKAFQNNRIYSLEGALVLRPGPRLAQGLEAIFECLHGVEF